jgi:hypothetical protein
MRDLALRAQDQAEAGQPFYIEFLCMAFPGCGCKTNTKEDCKNASPRATAKAGQVVSTRPLAEIIELAEGTNYSDEFIGGLIRSSLSVLKPICNSCPRATAEQAGPNEVEEMVKRLRHFEQNRIDEGDRYGAELLYRAARLLEAQQKVNRWEGEHCQECGCAYDEVYLLPDEIWAKISPKPAPAGLLCPVCALNRVVHLLEAQQKEGK